MRDMAKKTRDDPSRILAQAVTDIPIATRLEVGKTETVKRSLRRQRRAALPAEPKCTGDLILADAWKTTGGANPEPMLVRDSGETSKERLLAFASQKGLATLGSGSHWFVDRTFSVCPKLFCHVFVIRTIREGTPVTCVYGLLPGKKRLHEEFFQAIVDACEGSRCTPDPECIHMDFELVAHQAVQNVFGSLVKVKGCFYHSTQATFRKIQELGLVGLYREKDDIKQFCGMIDSLAFVPVKDLPQAIKFLKETCPPELEDLLDYFDTTYVSGSYKRINRRENIILKRIPPLFAPEVWNVLNATVSDGQ